ncbi:hypothetical protein [Pararhizobium sp. LjRoot238]|uniref:hypothetical protein n=1 Tax=Pararhizobium sp. LjRoot238 TaxID=3342293 RepID=UPI003ED11010
MANAMNLVKPAAVRRTVAPDRAAGRHILGADQFMFLKFALASARKDTAGRALKISRRLFEGKMRAGENTDLAQFQALGIAAHDISTVKGGIRKNHNKAFGDGMAIAGIGQVLAAGPVRNPVPNGLETLILAVPRLDGSLPTASTEARQP